MNITKLSSKNIVCYTKDELKNIFEISKKIELVDEMEKQGISMQSLASDPNKMKTLAGNISEKTLKDTNDHEIFASVFVFVDFYGSGSEICFELKDSFNKDKDKIITLGDLNNFRSDPPDFIIKSSDGFREFELKRYRKGLNTDEIFQEVKKRIEHYQNGLGNTSLLFVLQSPEGDISKVNFEELNLRIKALNPKFRGQVLISYNEANREMVINQVLPNLTTTRIPVQLPSQG